ncbi:MAG: hypothetical protein ACR2JY_02830 [Chloroflexota bacterium]
MTSALPALAQRVRDDPFFLASALMIYAESEAMDDQQLAAQLGCTTEALAPLRLCRRPRPEPPQFRQDVDVIAARFGLRADVLATAVRRADAVTALRQVAEGAQGTLVAARDRQGDTRPGTRDEAERP